MSRVKTGHSCRKGRICGFTLVELMVVLTIIALLLSIVVPDYMGKVHRAEEATLKENLTVMRDALDKHYADAGTYPAALGDLVSKHYLRAIPNDPFTQAPTWTVVPPADPKKGGVYDIHSSSKDIGSNGTPYDRW
jgi:general secretion pathway protein G